MPTEVLTKQYILDVHGVPIGVILPIEQYESLTKTPIAVDQNAQQTAVSPLFGALRSSEGGVASTVEIDETRQELWSAWDTGDL